MSDVMFDSTFAKKPQGWGLRGDPYLWRVLQMNLEMVTLPECAGEQEEILKAAFCRLTNVSLAGEIQNRELYQVQRQHYRFDREGTVEMRFLDYLPSGGMSGGVIHIPTWRDRLVPLLLRNASEVLKQET